MKFRPAAWSGAGICCACGRTVRTRGARLCPYCGERVLRPRLTVLAARLSLAVPAAGAAAVLFSAGVRAAIAAFPSRAGIAASCMASVGAALPLFPFDSADLVVSTTRESRTWRLASFLGGLYSALASFTLAAAFAAPPPAARLTAAFSLPFVLAVPFFWRVSYSILLSPFLFFIAFRMTAASYCAGQG